MSNGRLFPKASTCARVILLAAIPLTLVACSSSSDIARSNPNYFMTDISAGRLSGSYNPAGFKTAEVRDLLASSCKGKRLSGYSEAPADGLVAFAATCKDGTVAHGGNMEFQRNGGQVISEGLLYDEAGNMSTPRTASVNG